MEPLFVALGIMVLALLALLLWFVPHLLHQQASRVASETAQLREMLLDLLNEQESVAMRQTQLGATLAQLQSRIETLAQIGSAVPSSQLSSEAAASLHQLEARLTDLQSQIQIWSDGRQRGAQRRASQDNEAWANLMSLLSVIQDRIGTLSQDRATAAAAVQAGQLLEELELEMRHLRSISDDISKLQHRLRRSLSEREVGVNGIRGHIGNGVEVASGAPYLHHP